VTPEVIKKLHNYGYISWVNLSLEKLLDKISAMNYVWDLNGSHNSFRTCFVSNSIRHNLSFGKSSKEAVIKSLIWIMEIEQLV
jgi:hypothetical protein